MNADANEDSGLAGLSPPRLPHGLSPTDADRFTRDYLALEQAVRAKAWAHGLEALRTWPPRYLDEGGPDLELVVGYLLYKTELVDQAVDRLKPLTEDDAFVRARPAALYYLARAQYQAALFGPAVRHMEDYLAGRREGQPGSANSKR